MNFSQVFDIIRLKGEIMNRVKINGVEYTFKSNEVLVVIGNEIRCGDNVIYQQNQELEIELLGEPLAIYSNANVKVSGAVNGKINTQGNVNVGGNVNDIVTQGNVTVQGNSNKIITQGIVHVQGNVTGAIQTMGPVTVQGNQEGKINTMGNVTVKKS